MRGKTRDEVSGGRSWRAGFTLVELLVVVSIISLLMAIMLPALTRAQRQAEGVHCLANQRDLTLAWTQYAIDHDDMLCEPDCYAYEMKSYIPMSDTLQCKTAQTRSDKVSHGTKISTGIGPSYGMSNTMGGKARDGTVPFEKMHLVTQPARRMVFVDVGVSGVPIVTRAKPYWPLLREVDPDETDDNEPPWMWRPWPPLPSGGLQGTTARHDNGCNMSFADGHVEYTRWRDSRTVKLIKGTLADLESGSVDNPDLDHLVDILAPPSSKSMGGSNQDATHP